MFLNLNHLLATISGRLIDKKERGQEKCKTDIVTNTNPFLAYLYAKVWDILALSQTLFLLCCTWTMFVLLLQQKYNFENK